MSDNSVQDANSAHPAEICAPPATVSIVRVDTEFHVFEDSREAWDFYTEWREYRDCACLLEAPIRPAGEYESGRA